MAEVGGSGGARVRVVKCPKCEKLLPELANFTVYKCGGCNATLQAKKPAALMGAPLGERDGEKANMPENLESSSNKMVASEVISDTDFEVNSSGCLMENGSNEVAESDTKGSQTRKFLNEPRSPDRRIGNKVVLDGVDSKVGRYQHPSKALLRDKSPNAAEMPKTNAGEDLRFNEQNELPNVQREVERAPQAWKAEERGSLPSHRGALRVSTEGIGLGPYPDEGPSNYHMKQNVNGLNRVQNLDQDRAELLQKLDELRDRLRRSCEVTDTTRDRTPTHKRAVSSNPYGNHGQNAWFSDGSSSLNRASSRHDSFLNEHIADMPNVYPAMQNGFPGYREPFGSQSLGMPPFHRNVQHPQGSYNGYPCGQPDRDPVFSYSYDGLYHQPACSCQHCNRHWLVPAQAPPTIFGSRRAPYLVQNNGFYPVEEPLLFGQQSYNHRVASASLNSHGPLRKKRPIFNKDGRSCWPVAGAAPFVVCCNCSKVLELPSRLLLVKKKKFKLQCGSCSQVISVELDGKKLTTSVVIEDNSPTGGMKENLPCCDNLNQFPVMPYSGDYDSPGYEVGSSDDKLVLPSSFPNSSPEMLEKECGFNLSESEKMQGLSSSSSTTEDVESSDSLICQQDMPSSTELPVEVELPAHVPGLPLREHFAHPLSSHVMNGPGKGSRSRRSDQEKSVTVHGNFKQNSVKDVPVASEMDLSVDDGPNPGFSHDTWEVGRYENQPKARKGSDSFLAGLIKKSFKKDFRFNQSEENSKSKVSVNGHPISDRLVKKAEKQAGSIQPGDYWYDYRAGFWGVMGHQCLGIIPPFIEEFNYPMSKSCSGGSTGVIVNGRELHRKDLDLLVGRGLPPTEDCSYIVEISGKVWDEATGEELDSLGKLAPTVERVKHGFGMRVPRATT
ncbi:putative zinc-ribbon domain, plant, protein enhanced disease resistance 4 [Dioscorea sansibarensis]